MFSQRGRIAAGLFWIGLALLSPVTQAAVLVGQVIVASGEVSAITSQGKSRALARKSEFYSGEVLKTGANSRAQVKFIDDALLSLKPNTELRVDDYRFDSANKGNHASVMTLLKGGLRTVTGFISKQRPDAYRINTPVASIGVRGTDLEVTLDESGVLKVRFWRGSGFVLNKAGSLNLDAGTQTNSARVRDANTAPEIIVAQEVTTAPEVVTPPGLPEEARFSDAVSDRNSDGTNDALNKGTSADGTPQPPAIVQPPATGLPPPQTPPCIPTPNNPC